MPSQLIPDADLQEILDEPAMANTLGDELLYAVGRFVREDEEKFEARNAAFYKTFFHYSPYAPYWKKLYWSFKPVRSPENGEWLSFLEIAEWFGRQGKDEILNALVDGSSLAFGFKEPRSVGDKRQLIPIDVLTASLHNQDTDWEKSSIKGNGLAFLGVRIVSDVFVYADSPLLSNERAQTVTPDQLPTSVRPANTKDEPSFEEQLDKTVNSLSDQIKTAARKPYYDLIRKKFFTDNPAYPKNTRGLSDENLRLALVRLEERRKAQ